MQERGLSSADDLRQKGKNHRGKSVKKLEIRFARAGRMVATGRYRCLGR